MHTGTASTGRNSSPAQPMAPDFSGPVRVTTTSPPGMDYAARRSPYRMHLRTPMRQRPSFNAYRGANRTSPCRADSTSSAATTQRIGGSGAEDVQLQAAVTPVGAAGGGWKAPKESHFGGGGSHSAAAVEATRAAVASSSHSGGVTIEFRRGTTAAEACIHR